MKKARLIVCIALSIFMIATMVAGYASSSESAESDPVYGGTLVVSQSGQQYENNYYPPTCANGSIMQNARPSLEPLFEMASDGTLIPFLVKEYEVEDNGQKYIFHLQEGIQFQDGTDFNAEAVKWNMEQTKSEGVNTVYNLVESIDIVDEYTLVIHMTSPDLFFINTLATSQGSLMVSPTAIQEHDKTWAETNPVGTGPFILESWDYGVEMIYVRNDNYWQSDDSGNQLPYLDGITFKFITEDVTVTNAFKNGELDMVRSISSTMIDELQSDYAVTVYEYPSVQFNLWFSSGAEGSVYQDVLIRQAISYALDIPTIVEAIYGSEYSATNQLSYSGSQLWNDDIVGYPYNPDKARELLADAGYPDGFETSIIIENSPQNSLLCQIMQAYLKDVGITLNIDLADSARYAENVMFNSWGDGLTCIAYTFTPDELCAIRRMLYPTTSLFAHTIAYPSEYQDMMDDMLSQPTLDDAKAAYMEINKYLIDDICLLCPIWVNSYAIVQQDYVHGTGSGVDGETQIRYWSPETVWMENH